MSKAGNKDKSKSLEARIGINFQSKSIQSQATPNQSGSISKVVNRVVICTNAAAGSEESKEVRNYMRFGQKNYPRPYNS